ncbi:hypothetical protein EVAR_33519_1 [Eumeta japonica]|uniref:Uncharacterized protein n=1 Tax=Eumeta variegata TaxID=151549 RepID=A0A4C1VJS2_EUMVA|nr:hypothetical protein EVAR_33519_1 [Eumeta japonica]
MFLFQIGRFQLQAVYAVCSGVEVLLGIAASDAVTTSRIDDCRLLCSRVASASMKAERCRDVVKGCRPNNDVGIDRPPLVPRPPGPPARGQRPPPHTRCTTLLSAPRSAPLHTFHFFFFPH